jgi:transposase
MCVVNSAGRRVRRDRYATTIVTLRAAVESVRRPRHVAFEEGPLADWLYRHLKDCADEVVVCEPRRNALIAKDSDKDDAIDAEKLAQLLRGGFLKPVHHPESFDRVVFKQHVALYHQRVRQRVREANLILSFLRRFGIFVKECDLLEAEERAKLARRLPDAATLRQDLKCLWKSYDAVWDQVDQLRQRLVRQARREEPICRFEEVPGFGWIRGATFYAFLDTPWRFHGKSALWRYCGIGLERAHSGGGPVLVRVAQQANRRLRGVLIGAAKSAIQQQENPFAEQYHRWLAAGISPRNARRNVARSLAATLWGMWKNGSAYRPAWVGRSLAGKDVQVSLR